MVAWNLRGLREGPATAAVAVAEESPDVALLTEVGRTGWRLRRFERLTGMRGVSGVRRPRRGITNAVLARSPWRIVEHSTMPFERRGRAIPRGMVAAVLGRSGYRLTAASVHLGLSDPERVRHAQELTDLLPILRQPAVVAGDLNEPPDGAAAAWIAERLWDAFAEAGEGAGETYPSAGPTARIDYVFVSEGLRVERAWVKRDAAVELASDHLPVFADLTLVAG